MSIESRVTHAGERLAFVVPTAVLVAALVAIGLAAEPIVAFSLQVGDQLADPSLYVDAVLRRGR